MKYTSQQKVNVASHASVNKLKTTNSSYYLELLFLGALGAPTTIFLTYALAHAITGTAVLGAPAFLHLALPVVVFVFSAAVVFLPNPMHALLSLIGVFLSTVFVYLALGAEFLGLVFLIVYVGAVAILFIFVIMLLNVKSLTQRVPAKIQTVQVLGAILAILVVRLALQDVVPALSEQLRLNVRDFGLYETSAEQLAYFVTYESADVQTFASLYNTHSGLFVIITVVLLVAMIGAIVLATATLEGEELSCPRGEKPETASLSSVNVDSSSRPTSPQTLFSNETDFNGLSC